MMILWPASFVFACLSNEFARIQFPGIVSIVNANVGPNQVIYFLNNQSSAEITGLAVRFNVPVILSNGDISRQANNRNADQWYPPNVLNAFVVAVCEQLWPCYQLIANQIERHAFNPRRKVLIVLLAGENPRLRWPDLQMALREVFQYLWRINLLNVVIQLQAGKELQLFSYNPFAGSLLINLTER